MINRIIEGIGNNIGQIVDKGVEVATKMIKGLASAAVDLATAGGDALLDILRGIRKWLDAHADDVGAEGRKIAVALGKGVTEGIVGVDLSALATNLINKIKAQLGRIKKFFHIKSPSEYMADEIGRPLGQGLVMGLDQTHDEIDAAGTRMFEVLRNTLSDVPADIGMDINPTITPVLDLTQVKQEAKKLGEMTNVTPIRVAAEIAEARAQLDPDVDPELGAKVFKFEQNNYSPEALSEAEIYRQTQNQLSQAKSALGL